MRPTSECIPEQAPGRPAIPPGEVGSRENPYEAMTDIDTIVGNAWILSARYAGKGADAHFRFHDRTFAINADYEVQLVEGSHVEDWSDMENRQDNESALKLVKEVASRVKELR